MVSTKVKSNGAHFWLTELHIKSKGPFTQAIFVGAIRCNFCRVEDATNFKHVGNCCDIAAINRTENCTWFTRAILKLQLERDKNLVTFSKISAVVIETSVYV